MAVKRPNPKKDKSARRPRPPRPGTFTAGFLDPSHRNRLNQITLQADGEAPPEAFVPVLLTTTWAGAQIGMRANHCVDACRTLGYALGELGIPTELRAAEVIIRNEKTGRTVECAPLSPRWNGKELDGHCVLTLPDQGRYIDATLEQFPGLAELRGGPAVGRCGGFLDPRTGEFAAGHSAVRIPEGGNIALMRGPLMVLYTLSSDADTSAIVAHPHVQVGEPLFRRAAMNLISIVLGYVRETSHLPAALRDTPYPRLHAFMDAIGDAPLSRKDNGDALFTIDGRAMKLDEIPLAAGTVPAVAPA